MQPRARAAFARRVLGASLCVALGAPRVARADEPAPVAPELTLHWQGRGGCPSPAEVEAQFARLLGGPTRLPSGKHIEASAVVHATALDRWSVELATSMDGSEGRRNLAGDSCASVASAAALILALMIDPAAAERAILAPPTRAAPERPSPAPEAVVIATPPSPPRSVHATGRVFGGAVFALLPVPAPAAGLALGARTGRLAAELTFVATGEHRAGDADSATGDLHLLVGGARACGTLGGHAVVWQLCLGGELERLTGTGLASPVKTESILMGAGTGALVVTVPFGAHVGLSLDVDAAVRPYRPHFSDVNGTRIFQIPVASAFAALGILVTL